MKDQIIAKVKDLLAAGEIDGFLALRQEPAGVAPYLFRDPNELGDLSLGDGEEPGQHRYPLVKLLTRILNNAPDQTLGILVRGCDERALYRRFHDDRVEPMREKRVVMVGFSCPPELAQACRCEKPWPDHLTAGQRTEGVTPPQPPEDLLAALEEWFATFDRCVKCFGCRNVCPVCSCLECTMESEPHVPQRELPVAKSFLMTRAMHMVERCVYCNLCEQACPAGIPLTDLYRLVARLTGGAGRSQEMARRTA